MPRATEPPSRRPAERQSVVVGGAARSPLRRRRSHTADAAAASVSASEEAAAAVVAPAQRGSHTRQHAAQTAQVTAPSPVTLPPTSPRARRRGAAATTSTTAAAAAAGDFVEDALYKMQLRLNGLDATAAATVRRARLGGLRTSLRAACRRGVVSASHAAATVAIVQARARCTAADVPRHVLHAVADVRAAYDDTGTDHDTTALADAMASRLRIAGT